MTRAWLCAAVAVVSLDARAARAQTGSLVAAYAFDEGQGASVGDASGRGNNGSVGSATWTTQGRYGPALNFNGTGARVTVPDSASLRLTAGMTLEAWVRPTSVTSVWRDVIYKGNDNYFLEATSMTAGRPAAGGTFGEVYGTAALPANTWTHLAVTYDRANLRLYVNGAQVASVARTAAIATSANPLQIGGDSIYGQYFQGTIDEVRVYNVARTPAQIQADMATPIGTAAPDTQPPTAPGAPTATAVGNSQINLAWPAATDNVGVTGYRVERCQGAGCTAFAQIATPTGTSYNDPGLLPGTTYRYQVRATDAASNLGPYSNVATATTSAPDTQPPTPPGALTATAAGNTQINLTWSAATDNVGVTGYRVERCQDVGCTAFAQIAAPTGTSYSDTGLLAGTTYRYQVRATDGAGNLGPYTNVAAAATSAPDTQPPTAPGALTTSIAGITANLAWTAATDNVGVTGYRVERCQGVGCTSFVQIATPTGLSYVDAGLLAGTTYGYRVRAVDAAGTLGPFSNAASATTSSTTPGLVAAYAFDEGAGSSVGDASGRGNNGTIANATWTTQGRHGGALTFNGTNARVNVPDSASLRLTTGMTLEAWVRPSSVTSVWRDVIYKGNDNYFLEATSMTAARPAAGGTFGEVYGTTALPVNTWTHLAITYDRANLRLYVNGTQVASAARTASIATSTNPLHIGGDAIYGQYFQGTIDEVRVYDTALTPSQIQTDMTTPIGSGGGGPDTQAPSVLITTPLAGSILTGTAILTASATDAGSGVGGVQFQVDGVNVGAPVTTAPYSYALATGQFANGAHTIGAYAWDNVRNIAVAATVGVSFTNVSPGSPDQTGLWSGTLPWPLVAVHAHLLRTGQVLASDAQSIGGVASLWDPATSLFRDAPAPDNIFCAGHAPLPDGRLFVAGGHGGGHIGLTVANIFDPLSQSWTAAPPMTYPRWYPTVTALPDGRSLVTLGETSCDACQASIPEIYDPATNGWTALPTADLALPYYPHVYVLPSGKVYLAGTSEAPVTTYQLDLGGTQAWSVVESSGNDGGSSAMYRPGQILKSGTSADPDRPPPSSANTAYVIDATQASPSWRAVAPMAFTRTYHNLTLLPDGNVLATGGGTTTNAVGTGAGVLPAELWSPATEAWTTLAPMHAPRLYHSVALLLPDARVLVAGGGRFNGINEPTDQQSAETFAPPYLFKGPRPTIGAPPGPIAYNQSFSVQTQQAASIAQVVLMGTASVTHNINMNQRYVPLSFTAGPGTLSVTAPANANLAPPGYYMLFIIDTNGVPSVAAFVKLS